jgi:hypothetical protein
MATARPDALSDAEKEMLECAALEKCGDPVMAKRLVALRWWAEGHGYTKRRVIAVPESEVPPCSE